MKLERTTLQPNEIRLLQNMIKGEQERLNALKNKTDTQMADLFQLSKLALIFTNVHRASVSYITSG